MNPPATQVRETIEMKTQRFRKQMYDKLNSRNMKLFNDFRPFGLVFFNNKLTKKQIFQTFDFDIIPKLYYDCLSMRMYDQTDQERWERVFFFIKQAQMKSIYIRGQRDIKILDSISHVRFTHLVSLSLHNSKITSIVALIFIEAPNLKSLNLIYNHVYNFKPLNKVNFKLEKLYIYSRDSNEIDKQMPFISLQNSSRWNSELQSFRLEKYKFNQVIMQDLSFLVKLKHKQCFSVETNIQTSRRIVQPNLMRRYFDYKNMRRLIVFQIENPSQIPRQVLINEERLNEFLIQRMMLRM